MRFLIAFGEVDLRIGAVAQVNLTFLQAYGVDMGKVAASAECQSPTRKRAQSGDNLDIQNLQCCLPPTRRSHRRWFDASSARLDYGYGAYV